MDVKQQQKKKTFILGAGLSGLVAADLLLDTKKFDVTLLEHAPFSGGLASSFKMEGERIPRFNHHIVASNKTTLKYLKKYNLMGKNTWKRIKMAFGKDGELYEVANPFDLLRFKYLSFWGKFRFGLFGLYTIFLLNPNKINDKLDLDTWLNKYAGQEVKEKIWKNLYGRNKFNIPLKQISAKQFAHRLFEKEAYDDFTYPMKGLDGMIEGLERDIKKKNGKVLLSTKIVSVDFKKKSIVFEKEGKQTVEHFDLIINTIPIPEFLKRTSGLKKDYTKKLSRLRYVPVVGLAFGTKDFPHKKFYWINLFGEQVHVVYQHSLIIDKYKSKVTWCVRYGGSEADIGKPDEQIKQEYLSVLRKYFPDMKVKWCLVFREKYAEPIYDKDYMDYAPTYVTPINGLYHAGIQVTFPKIRNMSVALESGEIVAQKIIEKELKSSKSKGK